MYIAKCIYCSNDHFILTIEQKRIRISCVACGEYINDRVADNGIRNSLKWSKYNGEDETKEISQLKY